MAAFDINAPLESATVTFRVTRQFRLRLWLGLLLMKVAVRIMGGSPEIIKDEG